jgi:hypothetical protein
LLNLARARYLHEMPTLYRFLSASAAVTTLESLKLRLSRPSSLNDPFDCCPEFAADSSYPEEFKLCLEQMFLERRSAELGVLCFSRTWAHHLMWSHYADHHRGVALVFRFAAKPDLLPVIYQKARATVNLEQIRVRSEGVAAIRGFADTFTVKAPAWRYERETRMLIETKKCEVQDGSYFVRFDPETLHGIILGMRCEISESYFRRIFEQQPLAKAKIWRVKKTPGVFALLREESTKVADDREMD